MQGSTTASFFVCVSVLLGSKGHSFCVLFITLHCALQPSAKERSNAAGADTAFDQTWAVFGDFQKHLHRFGADRVV